MTDTNGTWMTPAAFQKLQDELEHLTTGGREKLREVLLSGGDPMVLPNRKIGAWMAALAEAGVEAIRLGTKEMSFHPKRFDAAFLAVKPMCGRFITTGTWEEYRRYMNILPAEVTGRNGPEPNYNVAPTHRQPVISRQER